MFFKIFFSPSVSRFPGSTLATVTSTRPANTRRYNGGDTKRDVNGTWQPKIIIAILIIKITIKRIGRGRLRAVNTVACTRVVAALPERRRQTMHAVVPRNRTFVLCVPPPPPSTFFSSDWRRQKQSYRREKVRNLYLECFSKSPFGLLSKCLSFRGNAIVCL